MTDTTTYETEARKIGTEHGRSAASWVELDEATAQQIDDAGNVFDVLEPFSPLSGEWADGYSVKRLAGDCLGDVTDEQLDDGYALDDETGQMVVRFDDLADAYEDAYWQAFNDEVERKVEAMRGPVPTLDTSARYQVNGWPKVAVRIERFTFGGSVVVVMVGNDREHVVEPDDLILIDEDAYCVECGQIGCEADGMARRSWVVRADPADGRDRT